MTSPARVPLAAMEPQRRKLLRGLAGLTSLGLLGACSGLVPGQSPPPTLFRLTPKSTFREDLPAVDWQLVLDTPVADAALNTTRIALMSSPMQVEYYARSSWTDRAPLMIQTLMIESFENSDRIVSVGREGAGLRADFILKSELRELQAEYYEGDKPVAHVMINAKLVAMPSRNIVASRTFERKIEAEADRLNDVVTAFDEALGKVLKSLVEWTISSGVVSYRR